MVKSLEGYFGEEYSPQKKDRKHSYTYCLLKPDGYKINKDVYKFMEEKEFTVSEIGSFEMSKEDVYLLYPQHKNAPFLEELVSYMTSGRVSVARVEADISKHELFYKLYEIIGGTFPRMASNDTIRHKYGEEIYGSRVVRNVIHSPMSEDEESRIKSLMSKYLKEE
jgi:nucleoside diphosphate kinase